METTTQRTFSSIVRNKVLDIVEQSTLSAIVRNIVLVICAFVMIFVLNNQETTAQRFRTTREAHAFFMVTVPLCFFGFMNLKSILNSIPTIEFVGINETQELEEESESQEMIEGIPVNELIAHLIKFRSFKRTEVETKFWIARHRFTEIADKLESIWILSRGENNARVLNPERSQFDMISTIRRYINTWILAKPIEIQSEPIEQKVELPHSPIDTENEIEWMLQTAVNT